MAKLARDEIRTTNSRGSVSVSLNPGNEDSPCVLLKDMFDPEK
jgi:hypothetical protein